MHPNTADISKRFPQYREVIKTITDPRRGGEVISIKPVSGGHSLGFRKIGTKDFLSVRVDNTAATMTAAKKQVKNWLGTTENFPALRPSKGKGHAPRSIFVPNGANA